jgi:hypothetical protein
VFVVLVVVAMAGLITAFVSLDSVLRDQRAHDPALWRAEGRTPGFFWWPDDGAHWVLASPLRARAMLRWLLHDPPWAAGREQTLCSVRRLRFGLITGILAGVGGALVGLIGLV